MSEIHSGATVPQTEIQTIPTEVKQPFYRRPLVQIAAIGAACLVVLTGVGEAVEDEELSSPSPPPAGTATEPLGMPPLAPEGIGGYKFTQMQPNDPERPVTWDRCRPISYVINHADSPPGGYEAITLAIESISAYTGLKFIEEGPTSEEAAPYRPPINKKLYGNRWSPVLIDWVRPRDYPSMKGYAGRAGPDTVSVGDSDERKYVSGIIALNSEHLNEVVTWPGGKEHLETIAIHEVGHLVGLDHSGQSTGVMSARPKYGSKLSEGDRRGLRELADQSRCHPHVP